MNMKTTSVALGGYFEDFIKAQIAQGRYNNASEVIRAGLTVIYFLPCMIGGKIVKGIYGTSSWFIALILGALFFGLLYVCTLFQRQVMPGFSKDMIPVLFLCMAGALAGAISSRKSSPPKK